MLKKIFFISTILVATSITAQEVDECGGMLPPIPEMTESKLVSLPYVDHALTTDWTGSKEPNNWNLISVELNNTGVVFHYDENEWFFNKENNSTETLFSKSIANALLLPPVNVKGITQLSLKLDASTDLPNIKPEEGEDPIKAAFTVMILKGMKNRYSSCQFFLQLMKDEGKEEGVEKENIIQYLETGKSKDEFASFDLTIKVPEPVDGDDNILNVVILGMRSYNELPYSICFKNVSLKDPNIPSNLCKVETTDLKVYGEGNAIVIEQTAEETSNVTIYSALGQKVKEQMIGVGQTTISVPGKGFYLVKSGDQVAKVLVK